MNISRWPKDDTRWYLGVRCKRCRSPILFALDRSGGVEEHQSAALTAKLVLTCTLDTCKHQADYTGAAVSQYQKRADEPIETRRNNESSKGRGRKRRV